MNPGLNVSAIVPLPPTPFTGQQTVTTGGTRVALAPSQLISQYVLIKALAANTGIIYVGNSTVTTTTGFALAAGESVPVVVNNLSAVYLDTSVNGSGVSFIAS